MSDRLGQKAKIRGGSSGFIGLDLEIAFGSGGDYDDSVGGPILFNNVRKDTGGFVNTVTVFGSPPGTALVVTPEAEGDWRVDLLLKTTENNVNPVVIGVSIAVNDFTTQFTGLNHDAANPDELALQIDLVGSWIAYGLVAGDAITTFFGPGAGSHVGSNTEVIYTYLGAAS